MRHIKQYCKFQFLRQHLKDSTKGVGLKKERRNIQRFKWDKIS
ncbi:hypothetical protein Cabys_2452 [Caldithrix abyssi DSM 13497]|uniref:Uncharacterized protein n=1 Tax=Caldithrix abyssi DSM 13497 TaxID=880073 RepID=A0A1J1CA90_CALAY|nr:hypothetical protein Cabys_2452 [Caldithrix abyssi DSM 13497]